MYGKFFILIGWLKGKLCLCPKFLLQEIIVTVVSASVGPGIDLPWLDVQGNQSGVRIHQPSFCQELLLVHGGYSHWRQYLEMILCFKTETQSDSTSESRTNRDETLLNDWHRWPLPNFDFGTLPQQKFLQPGGEVRLFFPSPSSPAIKGWHASFMQTAHLFAAL